MARGTRLLSVLAAAALAAALAAPLSAQDPPTLPRDTVPRPRPDTPRVPRPGPDSAAVPIPDEAVRADTLPDRPGQDTVPADSTIPAPVFPLFPEPRLADAAANTWVWDRDALARFHGLSLLELLDRVPGLVITREGGIGRPAGVAAFGAGGGRLRVFVDGWEQPPLSSATPEVQRIPLLDVQEVRVTRGLAETRVDVQTLRLRDIRPLAQVEGADGDFDTRILRALFARPVARRLMFHVGLDLVQSDGFRRIEPFAVNTAMVRASYAFSADRGIQVDYRTSSVETERRASSGGIVSPAVPNESSDRRELVVRARGRFLGRLWLDGAIGRTTLENAGDTITRPAEVVQAMARAALDVRLGTLSGGIRTRMPRVDDVEEEGFAADGTEVFARADLAPSPRLGAWGEARATSWGGVGVSGVELEGGARLALAGPLTVFGSLASGTRGVRFARDSVVTMRTVAGLVDPEGATVEVPVLLFRDVRSRVNGFRAGAEWLRGSVRAGAAFVVHDLDQVAPYGLAFDRTAEMRPGGTVSGMEAWASFPVLYRQIRFDLAYSDFFTEPERPYLPTRFGRAALELHWVYRGGNLEPTIRAEVIGRDQARGIDPETGELTALSDRYAVMNLYVQVRVLDVRAFWRLENVLHNYTVSDVPPFTLPGQRALFGVRWFFRN
ncbi:MAG TPA: TonB-dependent receptor plug domain-containing protein [Longimicrobium sp.]|nr:TonB-dependent receptor plug domain-containing protein [Longimicrobium sp.]